jgi:hypothetical protein
MKYKLTENTIQYNGKTLYQIQALKSFDHVKKGELGGWIENESNLSHEGNCWVYGDAQVYGKAWVGDNAQVFGYAQVYGKAWVYEDVHVYGDAKIHGNAKISGNAQIYGDTKVSGKVRIFGNSEVSHGEFSENLYYRIYGHEDEQIVYSENFEGTLVQIQYKNQTFKLNKRLKSKFTIEKALQLYKISKTDNDLLEGLL